jgi:uncharacterized protein YehS (DUF1456 family)
MKISVEDCEKDLIRLQKIIFSALKLKRDDFYPILNEEDFVIKVINKVCLEKKNDISKIKECIRDYINLSKELNRYKTESLKEAEVMFVISKGTIL